MSTPAPRYTGAAARVGSALRQASPCSRAASRRARSFFRVSIRRSWRSRRSSGLGGVPGASSAFACAACTVARPSQRYHASAPRQASAPSPLHSRRDSASLLRVSWVSAPLRRSRTNTSPLRTNALRLPLVSRSALAASRSARALPSSMAGAPPSMPTCQVSPIRVPLRFRMYCAALPSQRHHASSTGGPIQSGSAIASARRSGSAAVADREVSNRAAASGARRIVRSGIEVGRRVAAARAGACAEGRAGGSVAPRFPAQSGGLSRDARCLLSSTRA